jgi:hypothetical protein
MKSVNNPITQEDLQRHYASLIYQEDLKSLTARQLEIIALMMEDEYRKGLKGGDPNEREHREQGAY